MKPLLKKTDKINLADTNTDKKSKFGGNYMKKIISVLLATMMLLSTMIVSTTAFAANTTIQPTQVTNFADLLNKTDAGVIQKATTTSNNYEDVDRYVCNFTVSEKSFVFIQVTAESLGNFSPDVTTKIYNKSGTKSYNKFVKKDMYDNTNRKTAQYTRILLEPGEYILNEYNYDSYDGKFNAGSMNISATIGYTSASNSPLSVDYLGPVEGTSSTFKFKVNSLDKIENIYVSSENGSRNYDYDFLRNVGKSIALDANNCFTITINNKNDCWIEFGVLDIYGQDANTERVILSDYTATVTGITDQIYTGSPITQNISVKAGYNAVPVLITYQNNIQPGTATVVITGIEKTVGTITRTFNINAPVVQPTQPAQPSTTPSAQLTTSTVTKVSKPKATKIKKVKGSKKAVATTWTKVSGVKGYQVQVATDKKFKKNKKTVTIKKQKTTKKTVKKLKAKKKYYVRVRTYKTVNGKKVYSSWSKIKSVKTK